MGGVGVAFGVVMVWRRCGWVVVVLWLCCGCVVVVLWLCCGCVVVVLWLCCVCVVCVVCVLCVCGGCVVAVLWLCCGCVVVVLWLSIADPQAAVDRDYLYRRWLQEHVIGRQTPTTSTIEPEYSSSEKPVYRWREPTFA